MCRYGGSHVQATSRCAALTVAAVLVLAACAAGANAVAQARQPDAAGFWLGLWQGLISPVITGK